MKKLAKALSLTLALVLLCGAFAGCGDDQGDKIVYGTSADYAPYEFRTIIDGKDTIVGYDVSLAKKIAKDMDKELVIKDIGFDFLMTELKNGTVDMVIAACEITDERALVADFSDPYYLDEPAMIVVRKADLDKFNAMTDFSGKTVGAQTATTKEDIVKNDMEGAQLLSITLVPDLINNLLYNKCDAVVLDAAVARQYIEANSELAACNVTLGEALPYVVSVKKGDPKGLLPQINKSIADAKEKGLLESWMTEAIELSEK